MHGHTILNGGDLDENGNSKEAKLVMNAQNRLCQGCLNENDNFKKGNQTCMIKDIHMGAILTKMKIIKGEIDTKSYYLVIVDLLGWKHQRNLVLRLRLDSSF